MNRSEESRSRSHSRQRREGGLYSYLATPFDAAGNLCVDVLADYTAAVMRTGVAGVTCVASTCEGPYLSDAERFRVMDVVGKTVAGRIGLNIGIGALSTRQAIDHAKRAQDAGATSLMLEMQQYYPVSFEAARKHYEAVAAAVPVPIRLYNLPLPTRFDFMPGTIAAMEDIAAITSVKEASGDVTRLRDIRALCGDRFRLFCGFHFQVLDGYRMGADGWEVMTHPLIAPRLVSLVDLLETDPWSAEASAEYETLLPLFLFFKAYGVPQAIKALSEWSDIDLGPPRAPYAALLPAQKTRLRTILETLGLLH
ncbi:dihydrodipicolinate synthase family protein [Variovorax sp. RA8]|uniref:dihydrodipicolinate synthase family protein n=1 Tax=Variovorax sp. (strain JCM 16519 / RA8) TaxID=662548 RepID=UPI0013166124|nr:dihydrodipicolinate synthase family protein [Variovorax sp. RA8]VTU41762.1 4-hydroxy-tetrahydrodipicolinate synthase [Variovorax sp. RA8]